MSILSQARPHGRANEIIANVKISDVYHALTAKAPRRTGPDRWRATAAWRGGDGLNVSLDDTRGLWHDFTTDEGGGVLDLVIRVRGGSRQDALRWVADLVGCPLDDHPLPAFDRERWRREQRRIELHLPNARLWQRGALALGEEVLDRLKAALADPKLPWPGIGEIARWTAQVATWRRLDDATLVDEYLWRARNEPLMTRGLVHAANLRATAERRAICAYLRMAQPEDRL